MLSVDNSRHSELQPHSPSEQFAELATNLLRLVARIEHERLHGFPERAAYLERRLQGPKLIPGAPEKPTSLEAGLPLLRYWTGWGDDRLNDAVLLGCELAKAETATKKLATAPSPLPTRLDKAVRAEARARRRYVEGVEEIATAGLWARAGCYLVQAGAADVLCWRWLSEMRSDLGSCGSLRHICPWPDQPGLEAKNPYLIVCDRCTWVDLARRAGSRCRVCRGARQLADDALPELIAQPELPWLVTKVRPRYRLVCEVCGETFSSHKPAKTCPGSRCRTAKSRRARSGAERTA